MYNIKIYIFTPIQRTTLRFLALRLYNVQHKVFVFTPIQRTTLRFLALGLYNIQQNKFWTCAYTMYTIKISGFTHLQHTT